MKYLLPVASIVIMLLLITGCGTPQPGNKLTTEDRQFLQRMGLLTDDEPIILISNNSGFEIGGTYFTDRRVATYWRGERNPEKWYAVYPAISALKFIPSPGGGDAHQIRISLAGGGERPVYIGCEGEADARQFYDRLRQEWEHQRNGLVVLDPPAMAAQIPVADTEIRRPWPQWKRCALGAVAIIIALVGLVFVFRVARSLLSGVLPGRFILKLIAGWLIADIILVGGIGIVAFVVGFFVMGAGLVGLVSLVMTACIGCAALVVLNIVALVPLDLWLTRIVRRHRAEQLKYSLKPE